jgi:membrane-associated phospholipid phosphatase
LSKPTRAEPLVAWPGLDNLKLSLPIAASFLKFFFSVYGTTSLLAATRQARQGLHFDFELEFPFVPSLALLYLTVPLLLAATPFILRTWREMAPFFLTLSVQTAIGGLCFLVFPIAQGYPPREADGFWGGLFRLTDWINLEYNEVPSLHVAFAVTAAVVLSRRCRVWGKGLFALWAGGVTIASLLLHEHHLLDVTTGALLGLATVATIHPWASRERLLNALAVDFTWFGELVRSVLRHPRCLAAGVKMARSCLGRWERTRAWRATSCLLCHVDAVLAGERKVKGDRAAHVGGLLAGLRGEAPLPATPIGRLAGFVSAELAGRGAQEVHTRDDLARLREVSPHPGTGIASHLPWRVEP